MMILKGNQRGEGRQMALHLLNTKQNDHVSVHEVRGFISEDVLGALNEAHALSKGTQCKQFMYSLSLNPPENESVSTDTFERAIQKAEEKLGLVDQPRVVVFHEKEGRRHAHCVWSRIDIEQMKAINMSLDRTKLNELSKSIYLEQGWTLPEGFRNKNLKNPLSFTREEWEQAKRIGRKAADIKSELQECWAISDSKAGFENALKENGYILARGDKRSFVVMDSFGEIYSLPRQLNQNKKEIEARLGKSENLPDIEQAKQTLKQNISPLYFKYRKELTDHHTGEVQGLLIQKQAITNAHKKIREELKEYQQKRWQQEESQRASRVRHGLKGLWDKLSGRYWKTRKQNEQEAYSCYMRDKKQKDDLILKQLSERQNLQHKIQELHERQEEERKNLIRDFAHVDLQKSTKDKYQEFKSDMSWNFENDGPEMEIE